MSLNTKQISLKEFYRTNPKLKLNFAYKLEESFPIKTATSVTKALKKPKIIRKGFLLNNTDNEDWLKTRALTKNKKIFDSIEEKVIKYNKEFTENTKKYKIKKEENEEFLKKFKNLKKRNEEAEMINSTNSKGKHSVFSDLIHKYKKRGYKIPNLTLTNNIFNSSALLLEQNKLVSHFTSELKKEKNNFKDLNYLQNLNACIVEKTGVDQENNDQTTETSPSLKSKLSITFKQFKPFELKLNPEEVEKEIKKNEEEIRKNRETLADMNLIGNKKECTTIFSKSSEKNYTNSFSKQERSIKSPGQFSALSPVHSKVKIKESKNILKYVSEPPTLNNSILTTHYQNTVLESENISTNNVITTAESKPPILKSMHSKSIKTTEINSEILTPITSTPLISYKNKSKFQKSFQNLKLLKLIKEKDRSIMEQSPEIKKFQNKPTFSSQVSFSNQNDPFFNRFSNRKLIHSSNRSILSKKHNNLEIDSLYEKVAKKENINSALGDGTVYDDVSFYFKEKNKYQVALNQTQIAPKDLLRNFADTKFKVSHKNVYSTYTELAGKVGHCDLDLHTLDRIKQMDTTINNFDRDLIKSLVGSVAMDKK